MLPHEFPPWKTVYSFFRRLCIKGKWIEILEQLNKKNRILNGRQELPTFAIIDSQSVRTAYRGDERGFDRGKKNKGKKKADNSGHTGELN